VGLGGSANLHYAHELAERGYVCLVPEYATFGEHQVDVYARGWASGSMQAVWDNVTVQVSAWGSRLGADAP
jgi:hypothetical protein